ncbi:cupin domain-containing protein [Mesorhizobium sp.]|uniref:cupin domain-containing protein n=1 Tax=Mesorhizobium sp. TaxID=1871066 RepID=UPI00257E4852|nr:cupin domain-containing protein [Mesorhizobium sp.]
MSAWEAIAHEHVVAGDLPRQRRHRFYVGERRLPGQIRVGIWEATAYTERLVNYPKDEFMYVIEGSVTIVEEDGREETFGQGDSFFMPAGFTGLWRQDEAIKKYFMVFDAHDSGD